MTRHLLDVDDLDADELGVVLDLAEQDDPPPVLRGRGAALLFEKPSLRTRSSMELAVVQLGGHPVSILGEEASIDRRETAEDIARVLSRYHALLGARVFQFILIGLLSLWFIGWVGSVFLSSTRVVFAAAFDRVLPEWAASV